MGLRTLRQRLFEQWGHEAPTPLASVLGRHLNPNAERTKVVQTQQILGGASAEQHTHGMGSREFPHQGLDGRNAGTAGDDM